MPLKGPGVRFDATATKQINHGDPAVELNHAGIGHKSQQIAAMAPSVANAALAVQIAVGEDFVIDMDGDHEVAVSKLPGGAAVGNPLYIKVADNTLHLAADALTSGVLNAGFVKFGLIDSIDVTLGRAMVNLTQRSSF